MRNAQQIRGGNSGQNGAVSCQILLHILIKRIDLFLFAPGSKKGKDLCNRRNRNIFIFRSKQSWKLFRFSERICIKFKRVYNRRSFFNRRFTVWLRLFSRFSDRLCFRNRKYCRYRKCRCIRCRYS